ncbi:MFS transporter [Herpetosiphon geysericola]|uniref:Uncharacterized protein n=1 Tax=Herpetosiphon geysericola TaxID=70996 RepID=A0A0P6Y2V7_9CHLR|nr:hypothetical protein [Herpetosiphon geysericola]KPL90190.1 hypothetical protein SE18_08270 [Herpetosiphon geysericola]
MYNVPQNIEKPNWPLYLLDVLAPVVVILSIIIWVLIEDQRWYGINTKALTGAELRFYQQWHYLKYVELGLAICLASYSFAKRRSLKLRERLSWLMPIGLLWLYWMQLR